MYVLFQTLTVVIYWDFFWEYIIMARRWRRLTSSDIRDTVSSHDSWSEAHPVVDLENDGNFSDVDDVAEEYILYTTNTANIRRKYERFIYGRFSCWFFCFRKFCCVQCPNRNTRITRRWTNVPPGVHKVNEFHIFRGIARAILTANLGSAMDCFTQLIPETIVNVIVSEINRKAGEHYD